MIDDAELARRAAGPPEDFIDADELLDALVAVNVAVDALNRLLGTDAVTAVVSEP